MRTGTPLKDHFVGGHLDNINDWEGLAREAHFRPADMAALCLTSLRHLQRFFETRFNQTPGKWSRELRCRIARQLVSQGWSCKAIVIDLGFVDHAHLCHEFKRIYGVNPRKFAPGWVKSAKASIGPDKSSHDAVPSRSRSEFLFARPAGAG
jgi:AraC-like DNA-binding protein